MSLGLLADLAGFAGAAAVLSAFAWHSVTGQSGAPYHALNLIGAALLAASLSIHSNVAALALEIAWGLIALVGLARTAPRAT